MIKVGVLETQGGDYSALKKSVLECEKLEFDSVWLYDRLYPFMLSPTDPVFECWTTLSALAAETTRIRLGTLVLCNSYRSPSILAKMGATLDVISNGRLELGIGAGDPHSGHEHTAYGFKFESAAVRIERLAETLVVLKKLWTEEKSSYHGKYYNLKNAFNYPKPLQKPYPPLWVAGGLDKTVRLTAKHANGYNLWSASPSFYKEKMKILRSYCASVGRDYEEICKSWSGEMLIAKNQVELKEKIRKFYPENASAQVDQKITLNQFLETNIIGTPEECIDRLENYIDIGVSYFMLHFPDIKDLKSIEIFSQQVMPLIK